MNNIWPSKQVLLTHENFQYINITYTNSVAFAYYLLLITTYATSYI